MSWKFLSFQDNELCIQLCIFFLIGIIHGVSCSKVTIVPVREDITAPLLTCWTCSHSKLFPHKECIKLADNHNITKTECGLHEPFCMIQRLEADGKVEKIERSCTKDCDPGCHRYQTVKRCDICCTQPLCNDGNGADALQSPLIFQILSPLFAFFIHMIKD